MKFLPDACRVPLIGYQINDRENRRSNREWTSQRHRQHWVYYSERIQTKQAKMQHRRLKREATRTLQKENEPTRTLQKRE